MNQLKGQCPLCEAQITLASDTEVSEIVTCNECSGELEVKQVWLKTGKVLLAEAPAVAEDWGE